MPVPEAIKAFVRGAKRFVGIPPTAERILKNLEEANQLGQPEERREVLARIENELNTYAEKPGASAEKMQIIKNLKVLLGYYKARNIVEIVDKNAEYYRLEKEREKHVNYRVNGKRYTSGIIIESRDAVFTASEQLYRELMRDPKIKEFHQKSVAADAQPLMEKARREVAAEKSSIPATATSSTATNRFLSVVAQEVAAEQGARFAKAPTGTTKLSKAGHGGRRQTRRKHRKGKKSTRRR